MAGWEGAHIPGLTGRASGQTPGDAGFALYKQTRWGFASDDASQGSFSLGLAS